MQVDNTYIACVKPAYFKSTPTFKVVILGYLLIVFFALLPILLAILAGFIGNCMGCNINEGGTDECIRNGIHFGSILNIMAAGAWFFLLTIPAGIIAFIVWTIMGIHAAVYYAGSDNDF